MLCLFTSAAKHEKNLSAPELANLAQKKTNKYKEILTDVSLTFFIIMITEVLYESVSIVCADVGSVSRKPWLKISRKKTHREPSKQKNVALMAWRQLNKKQARNEEVNLRTLETAQKSAKLFLTSVCSEPTHSRQRVVRRFMLKRNQANPLTTL